MGFGKLLEVPMKLLPYNSFISLYPRIQMSKFADAADAVFYHKMLRSSLLIKDKETYLMRLRLNQKFMLIKRGLWGYKIANFCFVKDMLANIIWCVEQGYIPIIDIYPPKEGYYTVNTQPMWNLFYHQPLQYEDTCKVTKAEICPIVTSGVHPRFSDARNPEKIKFWHDMLETFVVYNESTTAYFKDEYERLIKGKQVVACVLRSTDYTKLRPTGHPIQPSIEEVFKKLHEVMDNYGIDYVYLATEDYHIADAFKKEFPNRVIENKRHYYNEQYDNENLVMVSQVHFDRENDDYLKMLEYMSSINLVSKCDYLVTGLSGGSEMAIYRNGNQYKYAYVFDKGLY